MPVPKAKGLIYLELEDDVTAAQMKYLEKIADKCRHMGFREIIEFYYNFNGSIPGDGEGFCVELTNAGPELYDFDGKITRYGGMRANFNAIYGNERIRINKSVSSITAEDLHSANLQLLSMTRLLGE